MKCVFCNLENKVIENELSYAIYDKYPVNKGHILIIPKRHFISFFEATDAEKKSIDDLLTKGKQLLDETLNPDGYNIGINNGIAAGQTIMHLHVHLIPRFTGDVKHPEGGVRGVIPERQKY